MRLNIGELDPIGESMIWFKWIFYNDAERCAVINGTCLQDGLPIDGPDRPEIYTTFYTFDDFFDKQNIETGLWIIIAISLLGVVAWPQEILFCYGFWGYVVFLSVQAYDWTKNLSNFETYAQDILNMLILVNGYTFLAANLFIFYSLVPIIGPAINIGIMYWVLLEMSRLSVQKKAVGDGIK